MHQFSMVALYSFILVLFFLEETVEAATLTEGLKNIEKNTYVVFGPGRRSERDLPICEGAYEACNIAHERLWLTPITERLCRCPRRTECPLVYNPRSSTQDTQEVSNRAQLKFCEGLDETFEPCTEDKPAVEVMQETIMVGDTEEVSRRTSLFCKCPWPNVLTLNKTTESKVTPRRSILIYMCNKLPRCQTHDTCGFIRKDTYEVYYRCSCPEEHLCLYREPKQVTHVSDLLHFKGDAYEGVCSPKYF